MSLETGIDFFIGLPKEEHYRAAHFMEMSLLEVATIRCMNLKCIQTAMCMATEPVSRKAFHTEHLSQVAFFFFRCILCEFNSFFALCSSQKDHF